MVYISKSKCEWDPRRERHTPMEAPDLIAESTFEDLVLEVLNAPDPAFPPATLEAAQPVQQATVQLAVDYLVGTEEAMHVDGTFQDVVHGYRSKLDSEASASSRGTLIVLLGILAVLLLWALPSVSRAMASMLAGIDGA